MTTTFLKLATSSIGPKERSDGIERCNGDVIISLRKEGRKEKKMDIENRKNTICQSCPVSQFFSSFPTFFSKPKIKK